MLVVYSIVWKPEVKKVYGTYGCRYQFHLFKNTAHSVHIQLCYSPLQRSSIFLLQLKYINILDDVGKLKRDCLSIASNISLSFPLTLFQWRCYWIPNIIIPRQRVIVVEKLVDPVVFCFFVVRCGKFSP